MEIKNEPSNTGNQEGNYNSTSSITKGSRLECIEEKTEYLNVIQSSNKTFTGKIFKTVHRNRR
jgi:hypothetical protein